MKELFLNLPPFKKFIFLEKVSSTMDVAFKLAKLGERNIVVLADNQWAGRGKDYKVWFSDDKSLSFSIIIDGEDLKKKPLMTILASVLVRRGIMSYLAIPVNLKWPNDIIFKGKKLGGILGENLDKFIIIGVGINVNNVKFPSYLTEAISLREIVDREIDKFELLTSIINEFSINYDLLVDGHELLIKEWKKACIMLGERVKFRSYNNILEGIITDISEDGALIITVDGKKRKIYSTDELILEGNLRTIWR
ncbi:MAG: biotin--[acetyl-CoA-carboxylase] ligase [bacterium]|nr:biotin--[acetyl-CoA-carboxylase] ligase [bacterium]